MITKMYPPSSSPLLTRHIAACMKDWARDNPSATVFVTGEDRQALQRWQGVVPGLIVLSNVNDVLRYPESLPTNALLLVDHMPLSQMRHTVRTLHVQQYETWLIGFTGTFSSYLL